MIMGISVRTAPDSARQKFDSVIHCGVWTVKGPHTPNPMASIPATIIDLHARLSRDYTHPRETEFYELFHRMSDEDSHRLIRLCETDISPGKMVLIGLCHQHGKGVPEDKSRAFEWFKRSAHFGDPDAMYQLAKCYHHGHGVKKDADLAIKWYQKTLDVDADLDDDTWLRDWHSEKSLDGLLRSKRDPHSYERYYCQLYESCDSHEGRNCYRDKIMELGTRELMETVRSWYRLDAQAERHATEISALQAEIQALRAQNELLKTEITYQPGGVGFREALTEFVGLASSPTTAPAPPNGPDCPQDC